MASVHIIDGVRWYPFLVEKEGRPEHLVLFSQKLKNVRQLYVRMTNNGYKSFASFSSPISLYNYIKRRPLRLRCFDEIVADSYQKVRFDIDIEYKEEGGKDTSTENKTLMMTRKKRILDELIQNVTDHLITSMFNIIPDLRPERIMYFSSHGEDKRSVHLVFPDYHTSCCEEARELYRQVARFIPKQYLQYIDHGIYGDNKSLRIMDCCKWGSDRFKQLNDRFVLSGVEVKYEGAQPDTSNVRFISSLVSFITDSKCLPNLLSPTSKQKIKRELLPGGIVSLCIERAKTVLSTDYTFEYEKVEGNVIVLKRIAPSYCKLCNRIHESQHPYLLLYDADLYFNCRRCSDKKLGLFLGNINGKEMVEIKQCEEDIGVKIIETEEGGKIVKSRGSTFYFGKRKDTSESESSSETSSETSSECSSSAGVNLSETHNITSPNPTKEITTGDIRRNDRDDIRRNDRSDDRNDRDDIRRNDRRKGKEEMTTPEDKPKLTSSSRISEILSSSNSGNTKSRGTAKRRGGFRKGYLPEEKKKVTNIINIENIAW
jgi:hypothetical protein